MKAKTRKLVASLISGFMERFLADTVPTDELEQIEREGVSPSGLLAPFHDALVPGIRLLNERSFSTRLGNLHEKVAEVVALEAHADARSAFDLAGSIPIVTREWITQRVEQLERRQAEPDTEFERRNILGGIGAKIDVSIPDMDLYIRTHSGEEHFFEMKSPKANKGQCKEMKRQIMTAAAIQQSERARAWWGIPYNPYGLGSFSHSFALPFFDFEHEVKIGPEFWNFVGGDDGTYEELLEIYREVGETFSERLREVRGRLLI